MIIGTFCRRAMSLANIVALITIVIYATPNRGRADLNCNTTQSIESSQTAADDYVKTNAGTCFHVLGANTVFNLGGHKIKCDREDGDCGTAIWIEHSGAKVKNGEIVSGLGDWNKGVRCWNAVLQVYAACEVSNMLIENAVSVAIEGGKKIEDTVMTETPVCIDSGGAVASGGYYKQNYCSATDTGFEVDGPTSGSFDIERNFIRASDTNGIGVLINDGNVDLLHNVVDASTPIDDTNGDSVTLTENICSDATDCPDPDERGFTFNLNFN